MKITTTNFNHLEVDCLKVTAFRECGLDDKVAPSKYPVSACGSGNPLSFKNCYPLKKDLRHPLTSHPLRKNKQTNMSKPIFNELNLKELTYAFKYVKGVFLMLNYLQVACLGPMFEVLALSKVLILSSLNIFLDESKNSFKLV